MVVRNVEWYSFVEALVLLAVLAFVGRYVWQNLDKWYVWAVIFAILLLFGVAELLKYRRETKPEEPLKQG